MKKVMSYILMAVLLIPLGVKAELGVNVKTVTAIVNDNTITFNGTTQDNSVAVMCKLFDDSATPVEVDKLSVEVNNTAFTGNFIAEETGTYTVSCANYDGGTIVSDEAVVETMSIYTVTLNANGGTLTTPASVHVTHGNTLGELSDPELEGKVFDGWCVDATTSTLFDFSTKITRNMTLYARWIDPITQLQVVYGGDGAFQVDFDTDHPDDQGPMGVMINHSARYFVSSGTTVTLTAEVPQDQRFVGWYTTHEEDNPDDPEHTIWVNDDLLSEEIIYEFYAEGTFINVKPFFAPDVGPELHTVTFNTKGGSAMNPVQVLDGRTLDIPNEPTKEDYVFIGWYEDDTCEMAFDFSRTIHGSFTLYAKWLAEEDLRDADQIQIWASPGGRVAAGYTPSNPNVYNLPTLDGTNFVENGEVVQYYVNDDVTAKASADEGFRFVGWKHVNTENEIPDGMEEPPKCIGEVFSTAANFTYKPSVTVIDGDESPIRYVCAEFEEGNGDEPEQESYSLGDDDGNQILFNHDEGQTLSLVILDISNLTDEELEQMQVSRELYDNVKESVANEVKKNGTLLQYLNISVVNNNFDEIDMSHTPVSIKLKMTDDMKEYNSFKLICFDVNEQGIVTYGDPISLTVKEIDGVKYLVGDLPHLSTYVLVGDTVTTGSIINPKTYDSILTWVFAFVISLGCIATITITTRKRKI